MRFIRNFNFKNVEIFRFRSVEEKCIGFVLSMDLRRKMKYSDVLSNYYDNEEEFLQEVGNNYIKVVVLSNKEISAAGKEKVECFFAQLLDGPNNRDWNIEFELINDVDLKSIYNDSSNVIESNIRIYNYFKDFVTKYGVSLPNIIINDDVMSYLSQE